MDQLKLNPSNLIFRTTNNSITDDIGVPSVTSNGKSRTLSNSNSLTNVANDEAKSTSMNQNGDELLLNSCKSLNGISSLVSDAIKSGVHTDQITKSLGINGTEITPLWKNLGIISANNVNNNTSNSSGENSTTSLNEMGKVSSARYRY